MRMYCEKQRAPVAAVDLLPRRRRSRERTRPDRPRRSRADALGRHVVAADDLLTCQFVLNGAAGVEAQPESLMPKAMRMILARIPPHSTSSLGQCCFLLFRGQWPQLGAWPHGSHQGRRHGVAGRPSGWAFPVQRGHCTGAPRRGWTRAARRAGAIVAVDRHGVHMSSRKMTRRFVHGTTRVRFSQLGCWRVSSMMFHASRSPSRR